MAAASVSDEIPAKRSDTCSFRLSGDQRAIGQLVEAQVVVVVVVLSEARRQARSAAGTAT